MVEKIDAISYKLNRALHLNVHEVFHVSQLSQCYSKSEVFHVSQLSQCYSISEKCAGNAHEKCTSIFAFLGSSVNTN